jgi:hypothetical protein
VISTHVPPPVMIDSEAERRWVTHMLCWSCAMYFSTAASSTGRQIFCAGALSRRIAAERAAMGARHTDKTFVEIDGADRYYCSQPEKMQECLAAGWDAFAGRDCSRSDADPQLRAAAPSYSWDAH